MKGGAEASDRPHLLRDYHRASRYGLRQWPQLAGLTALSLFASGFAVMQPWPLKFLIDDAFGTAPLPDWIAALISAPSGEKPVGILIVVAAFASFLVAGLASLAEVSLAYGWLKAGQRMVYDLAADLYDKIQQRSLAQHQQHRLGDSLNRLFTDSWSLYTIAYAALTVPLQHLTTIVAIAFVAWRMDPSLTVIAFAVIPAATAIAYLLAQRVRRFAREEARTLSDIMAFVQQTLSAIPLIQAFMAVPHTTSVFQRLADRNVAAARRSAVASQAVLGISNASIAAVTASMLILGGARVLAGTMTLGALVVFLAYLKTMSISVDACLTVAAKVMAANAGLRRAGEILDEEPGVAEADSAKPYRRPDSGRAGRIAFEHVTFGYDGAEPVLLDADFEVRPGECIALVGSSGVGKSTLASLIPRFFDPVAGRVLLDGQEVRELTLASLRAQISLVPQDPFLMPLTIAENIGYDPRGHSRDAIVAAAVKSGAHNFIRLLPQGFDTPVGENGAILSGGQRQLIAIARALLKDAPVLILDEPTASLDAETEAHVLASLKGLMADRTTIVIAHRLSTIRAADRILLIEKGRLRELRSVAEIDGFRRAAQ